MPAATAQQLIATVRVGTVPVGIAVNSTTNKIYVSNLEGTVTVIDGVTFATTTVVVGDSPYGAAVNPVTNQTYVSNVCGNDPTCQSDGTVTVIDGVTLATTTVVVGAQPGSVVVNPVTNKIYVLNRCGDQPNCVQYSSGTVTVIDGVTLSTATVPVGISASSIAVNPQSNKIYVTNSCGSDPTCQSDGTVTQIDGASLSTTTIPVGLDPVGIAVDSVANKIYDLDSGGFTGDVTVIDGTTLSTTTVPAGVRPSSIDVNSVTHKIYVGNLLGGNITVIDGATLSTTTVSVETEPSAVAVDSVTNKIYVHNRCGNDPTCQLEKSSVTVIDGASLSVANIGFGQAIGQALVVDPVHNRIYVPDSDFDVGIIDGTVPSPLAFIPSTPCRVVDTRNPAGEFGGPPIQGNSYRSFPIPQGSCNIPSTAAAYSLNVTVVPHGPLGYLTIWPSGEAQPYVSTMNSPDGRIKAN
ncbi:MAG: YncE family protein, partial [Candidatus Korobacteraceae bacterium]